MEQWVQTQNLHFVHAKERNEVKKRVRGMKKGKKI